MGTIAEYFKSIGRTVTTCGDGMAVTFSHLLRKPSTIQYPDRTKKPLVDLLPERSRGMLEVDVDICTGCKACARNCPIDCIKVEVAKDEETKTRNLTNFIIDLGKCMYCGICTENCPTGAIRHTKEFEGAMADINRLKIEFVTAPQPVAKVKKGEEPPKKPLGSLVRPHLKHQFRSAAKGEN